MGVFCRPEPPQTAGLLHLYIYRLYSQIKHLLKSTAFKGNRAGGKKGEVCPDPNGDETVGLGAEKF